MIFDPCPEKDEKPLDKLDPTGGFTAIFRTIGCIGDSLSSGEFEATDPETGGKTYHDTFEYSWGQFLARMIGSRVRNFSRGGMKAKEYYESFAESKGFWGKDKLCDAYIVALGVNDVTNALAGGGEIGAADDIDPKNGENNKKTVLGYYGRIITRLRQNRPDAFFFPVTVPHDHRGNGKPARRELEDRLNDGIRRLPDLFPRTYVLDFARYAPEFDGTFVQNYQLGGHLNPMGYLLIARMVGSYIDYIIRHNMNDFKQVGFIGTPWRNTKDGGAFPPDEK